jgi:hypothetical protein
MSPTSDYYAVVSKLREAELQIVYLAYSPQGWSLAVAEYLLKQKLPDEINQPGVIYHRPYKRF